MSRQFAAFVVVGGFAAAVNVVSRWLLSSLMSFELAVVVAFFCGLTTGFLLNRVFVFKAVGGARARQAVRFTLVNLLALAQVWIIGVGLARVVFPRLEFTWHADTVAHLIGVLSPVATSYFAHKHFSFAPAL